MNPALSEKVVPHVRPDATWPALIKNSAREVFQLMVGIEIDSPSVVPDQPSGKVSALIGMAGALCAIFRIRCTEETALSIANLMLGGQSSSTDSHTCDAIGELCNMIAGNFKAKVTGLADGCMLSVPTVVTGDDYEVHRVGDGPNIDVCLAYNSQPVWVSLEISG
jgi:chemotaxis protein CheX